MGGAKKGTPRKGTKLSTPKKNESSTATEKRPRSSSSNVNKRKRSQHESSADSISSVTKKPTPTKARTPKTASTKASKAKDKPQNSKLDVTVHRLRHLDYQPSPIVCLQSTPNNGSEVALSRDNGSVELLSAKEKYRSLALIAGYREKVVNAMVWTCGEISTTTSNTATTVSSRRSIPTLVGGSRDGTLFVIDFATRSFQGMTASGGGGVFAMASLCHDDSCSDSCCQLIAVGCEDGSIRIFNVVMGEKNTKLELVSVIPSASGGSVLSLAWRRSRKKKKRMGTILFAGLSDGTIRRYDSVESASGTTANNNPTKSRTYLQQESGLVGSWRSRLRMTVECLGRNAPTHVWALHALSDGTLISGDSLGHVQFWDGKTGTLQQSFDQNDNKADVLSIAISADQNKIFASGVDSRVVCIERPAIDAVTSDQQHEQRKWILTQAQRPHTHDVKALAICRQPREESNIENNNDASLNYKEALCSGGIDTKFCIYSVARFKKERPRPIYPWPCFSPVTQAKDARVLILRRDRQIDFFKIADDARSQQQQINASYAVADQETRLGVIQVQSPSNLVDASISDDGKFVAVCDASSLMVFQIQYVEDGSFTSVAPTKLSLDTKELTASVVCLKFGANDQLLVACSDGSIHGFHMPTESNEDSCALTVTVKQMNAKSQLSTHALFPVHAIEISGDRQWFATLQSGHNCSAVRTFRFAEDGETFQLWWSLPELEFPATAIKFLDAKTGTFELIAACANYGFYNFDVRNKKLTIWSEKSGPSDSKRLPAELSDRRDHPIRISANPKDPSKILLGAFGAFALFDMRQSLPKHCRFLPEHHVRGHNNKHKRMAGRTEDKRTEGGYNSEELVICLRYNGMLHMDFIADNEMIVVEQPWLNVVANFPAALERKMYGT